MRQTEVGLRGRTREFIARQRAIVGVTLSDVEGHTASCEANGLDNRCVRKPSCYRCSPEVMQYQLCSEETKKQRNS